jgi:hypothetical protein
MLAKKHSRNLLKKYNADIKEDEMGGACGMHRKDGKCIHHSGWKTGRKKNPFERPRRRWEENIRMDLMETAWDGVDWIHLAQDSVR